MTAQKVALGTIADVSNGYAFKSQEYVSSGIRIIRITNVQKGYVHDDNPKFIDISRSAEFAPFMLSAGDILLSLTGNVGRVGVIQDAMLPAALNQRVAALKFNSNSRIDRRYLFHVLNSDKFEREAIKNSKGIAQLNLSSKWVEKYEIPLPPLHEQKRIAKILDAADALRAKRRESLAQLDALLQSTFLEMFGDPVENPKGWPRVKLEKWAPIDAPLVDPQEPEHESLLHYGPDRIEKGTGRLLAAMTAKEDGLISKKFLCQPGDILYSKIRPNLNKVAISQKVCLCSADVYPVRVDERIGTREYLWTLLRSEAFLDYAAGFSRRANIPKLNRKQFAGYEAPLPPLKNQKQFSRVVQAIHRQGVLNAAAARELDSLFACLQLRAFKGEL